MRKIFLDCGAHNGSSVRYFQKHFADAAEYEIFCFEPNPHLAKYHPIPGTNFLQQAVWIRDCTMPFFVEGECESSTLNTFKGSRIREQADVECVDMARWLVENCDASDQVIMKLDIEGAEYEVIEHLAQQGTLSLISQMFGELHNFKCNRWEEDDRRLIETLRESNLQMYIWSAESGRGPYDRWYLPPEENPVWPRMPGDPPEAIQRTRDFLRENFPHRYVA